MRRTQEVPDTAFDIRVRGIATFKNEEKEKRRMSKVPDNPKIYHIIHVDRLESIISTGFLYSDRLVQKKGLAGTNIGMDNIKARRMTKELASHDSLCVGECVPFYFCPRSVMLFLIHRGNSELSYQGGQNNIIHLESDLESAVTWAGKRELRWSFTLSNAGSYYFEDRADLKDLGDINWAAVKTDQWGGPGVSPSIKEGKQAEFLIEKKFPWKLFSRIGIVRDERLSNKVNKILNGAEHKPSLTYQPGWYY